MKIKTPKPITIDLETFRIEPRPHYPPRKGKPAEECPDGPRYMTHGNSMPVPVMRWLARRTERVLLDYRARCAELQEAMA